MLKRLVLLVLIHFFEQLSNTLHPDKYEIMILLLVYVFHICLTAHVQNLCRHRMYGEPIYSYDWEVGVKLWRHKVFQVKYRFCE